MIAQGNRRFFASTRGQIVMLLRRKNHTVDELALELSLTDNAVRAHLATLERDGIVQQRGARRGSGKPAYVYELTTQAESLFPKAYGSILHELLNVLSQRVSAQELENVLRTVGQRIAAQWRPPLNDPQARLRQAVDVLNELGGLAELEEDEESYTICGYSCPLAAILPGHPETCKLAEALVSEIIGQLASERCERGETPRCLFSVPRKAIDKEAHA